jgi:hypothetical protein
VCKNWQHQNKTKTLQPHDKNSVKMWQKLATGGKELSTIEQKSVISFQNLGEVRTKIRNITAK